MFAVRRNLGGVKVPCSSSDGLAWWLDDLLDSIVHSVFDVFAHVRTSS